MQTVNTYQDKCNHFEFHTNAIQTIMHRSTSDMHFILCGSRTVHVNRLHVLHYDQLLITIPSCCNFNIKLVCTPNCLGHITPNIWTTTLQMYGPHHSKHMDHITPNNITNKCMDHILTTIHLVRQNNTQTLPIYTNTHIHIFPLGYV